jgi:hypothetical protein
LEDSEKEDMDNDFLGNLFDEVRLVVDQCPEVLSSPYLLW